MYEMSNGEFMSKDAVRFLYYFLHKTRIKEFGPYQTVEEAQEAFQKRYGYWPGEPKSIGSYWGPSSSINKE